MTDNLVEIGGRSIEVWPKNQMLYSLGSPSLVKTTFSDIDIYHGGVTKRILETAAELELSKASGKPSCGRKVYDPESWGCPEADLIGARAQVLFRKVMNCSTAAVDNSWATLYLDGDFCLPHSHLRAEASVVYMLDPGEEHPRWNGNGRLGFADPRLPVCCQEQAGCMTTPQFPELKPGDMVIFPGQTIHLVCPYEGERPRITLSWNINCEPIPGAGAHHAERRRRMTEPSR